MSRPKHAKRSPVEAAFHTAETLQETRQELQTDSSLQISRYGANVRLVSDDTAPELCVANVKWPAGANLQQGQCKGKVVTSLSQRSMSPLSCSANASATCYGSARNCDPIKHDPRIARPSSNCGSCTRNGDGTRANCLLCRTGKKAIQ